MNYYRAQTLAVLATHTLLATLFTPYQAFAGNMRGVYKTENEDEIDVLDELVADTATSGVESITETEYNAALADPGDGVLEISGATVLEFVLWGTGTFPEGSNADTNPIRKVRFQSLRRVLKDFVMDMGDESLTEVLLPELEFVHGNGTGFRIDGIPNLDRLKAPKLESIDTGDFNVSNSGVYAVEVDHLATVGGYFSAYGLPTATRIGIQSLAEVGASFDVSGNVMLPSLSAPELVSVGLNLNASGCTILADVNLPKFIPTNGKTINFSGCALTAASVNHILARCLVGMTSGTIDLSGGTNAAPTGQGIDDKATLLGFGVDVTTN